MEYLRYCFFAFIIIVPFFIGILLLAAWAYWKTGKPDSGKKKADWTEYLTH